MLLIDQIAGVREQAAAKSALRHRVVSGLFSGLISGLISSLVAGAAFGGAARADQLPSLQAQADRLAAQIGKGASRIAALTALYGSLTQQSAGASAQLASAQADLAATEKTISANRGLLHREAVTAYMEDGGAKGQSVPGDGSTSLIVRRQYLQLASGSLTDTLDQLHAGLIGLRMAETSLKQAQSAARRVVDRVTQARQAAIAEASHEQQTLDSIHGRLAQLVAQAAGQQATRSATAQGLPVHGGLLSVVTKAVAAQTPNGSPGPPAAGGRGGAGGVWADLRRCESGDNYAANTGNGYYGAYQFSQATWTGLGYPGRPDLEPPAMQDAAAQKLQARSGWGQWPACSAALGLK